MISQSQKEHCEGNQSGPPSPSGPLPKFFADFMLGTLARWLRILGFDTAYDHKRTSMQMLEHILEENRIILTRNRRLVERRLLRDRSLFIQGNSLEAQLREVVQAVGYSPDPSLMLTRCLECNSLLLPVEKDSVQSIVPAYVFQTQDSFRSCEVCGRIYWAGTHRERMLSRLQLLLGS